MKAALFATAAAEGAVRCGLCPHNCLIKPGKTGKCKVRKNVDGTLYSLVYGKAISVHVDPIEKKPLFHFLPGTLSFSIATVGCNMTCRHCQNADISQMPRDRHVIQGHDMLPEWAVATAMAKGCRSISYTYTEPTVFFEYALDIAVLAAKEGLKNVFVTNGYTSAPAIRTIAPYLDGANVDLKSFRDDFYRRICGARLAPVLDALRLYRELGVLLEVTTLVIPGENDSEDELRDLAAFIRRDLGEDVPWHVSAFQPRYRLTNRPRTEAALLRRVRDIGLAEGLRYVYVGNVPGESESTSCPSCGEVVIARHGFTVREDRLADGACPSCGAAVAGIWK